jgi:hypothetical protein
VQHVAIVHRRFVKPILSGGKSIEARLSRTRRAPFGRVTAGDIIWLKSVGGLFFARATADRILSAELRCDHDLDHLRRAFSITIAAGDEFWAMKRGSRYATLIWLADVVPITRGPKFRAHPNDRPRDAWFVLESVPAWNTDLTALPLVPSRAPVRRGKPRTKSD